VNRLSKRAERIADAEQRRRRDDSVAQVFGLFGNAWAPQDFPPALRGLDPPCALPVLAHTGATRIPIRGPSPFAGHGPRGPHLSLLRVRLAMAERWLCVTLPASGPGGERRSSSFQPGWRRWLPGAAVASGCSGHGRALVALGESSLRAISRSMGVVWATGGGSWSAHLPGSISFADCACGMTRGPTSNEAFLSLVCALICWESLRKTWLPD
jgi:hypothetical protein